MGPKDYFPLEGSRVRICIALKSALPSAGFEPSNLGSNRKHATTRPPTTTCSLVHSTVCFHTLNNFVRHGITPS
jgi:hypothetical protein